MQHRIHGEQQQAKPGQARQQHRSRNHPANRIAQKGTDDENHRLEKAPDKGNLEGELRIFRTQVHRHNDEKRHGKNRRRTRPGRERGHICPASRFGEKIAEDEVARAGEENPEAKCWCDEAVDDFLGKAYHKQQQGDHPSNCWQAVRNTRPSRLFSAVRKAAQHALFAGRARSVQMDQREVGEAVFV